MTLTLMSYTGVLDSIQIFRPDMTEKLLTGTLSLNKNKAFKFEIQVSWPSSQDHRRIFMLNFYVKDFRISLLPNPVIVHI